MSDPGRYGPRDALCVLMNRGHRVSLRWSAAGRWYLLDGERVSWRELEDRADGYEHLRYRITERARIRPGPGPYGPSGWLRAFTARWFR